MYLYLLRLPHIIYHRAWQNKNFTPAVLRKRYNFNLTHPSCPAHRMLLQQATLSRDSVSDCCYAWSRTKALSFKLLLQTGPAPRDLISPSSSSRLSKTELSLTPLLQHAAVPMDPASPHWYNMPQ